MKKAILVAITIIALIVAIGSIGAHEQGNIGFFQCIIQVAACIAVEYMALKHAN